VANDGTPHKQRLTIHISLPHCYLALKRRTGGQAFMHRVVIEQRAVHDYRETKTNQKPKPKRISQNTTVRSEQHNSAKNDKTLAFGFSSTWLKKWRQLLTLTLKLL